MQLRQGLENERTYQEIYNPRNTALFSLPRLILQEPRTESQRLLYRPQLRVYNALKSGPVRE